MSKLELMTRSIAEFRTLPLLRDALRPKLLSSKLWVSAEALAQAGINERVLT